MACRLEPSVPSSSHRFLHGIASGSFAPVGADSGVHSVAQDGTEADADASLSASTCDVFFSRPARAQPVLRLNRVGRKRAVGAQQLAAILELPRSLQPSVG